MKQFVLLAIGVIAFTAYAENKVISQQELDNAKALKRWVLNKKKLKADVEMNNLAKQSAINSEFDKIKGKTIVWRGRVRKIDERTWFEGVFVSLYDETGDVSVFFVDRTKKFIEQYLGWKNGEEHTIRGRIVGQGDWIDDAECCMIGIVDDAFSVQSNKGGMKDVLQ